MRPSPGITSVLPPHIQTVFAERVAPRAPMRLVVMHVMATLGAYVALPVHAAAPAPLVSSASQRCLDIAGGSQQPGTPAIIFDCHGGINQKWELTAAGELRTFDGARCLDVKGASTQPQAIVQSYTCNGGANQKWTLRAD